MDHKRFQSSRRPLTDIGDLQVATWEITHSRVTRHFVSAAAALKILGTKFTFIRPSFLALLLSSFVPVLKLDGGVNDGKGNSRYHSGPPPGKEILKTNFPNQFCHPVERKETTIEMEIAVSTVNTLI